jgi:sugar phosphate permease
MQGSITCTVALVLFFLLVDFPEKAPSKLNFNLRFLSEKEADFVVARIEEDRDDVMPQEFRVGQYLSNALDLKVWGFAALSALITTNSYAIAYFLPIILNDGMGFGIAASECLITPPNVAAAIFMYAWGYLGDKYHLRAPFILINGLLALIG